MASEVRVSASSVVSAPQQRAFELISDSSRYSDWFPATLEMLESGPLSRGATYRERTRFLGPITFEPTWTVEEHEPPLRTVHRTEDIPLTSWARFEAEVVPQGDEACEVTFARAAA